MDLKGEKDKKEGKAVVNTSANLEPTPEYYREPCILKAIQLHLFAELMTVVEKKDERKRGECLMLFCSFLAHFSAGFLKAGTQCTVSRRIPLRLSHSGTHLEANIKPNGLSPTSVESAASQPVNIEFTVHRGNFILAELPRTNAIGSVFAEKSSFQSVSFKGPR
ncbi:hypothetical protein C8R45DRAFT_922770 [Mycena sanguinolenta]|nr:hypothetical protein C8R45DRAFT_922770 [Mycena sanguinolenta]